MNEEEKVLRAAFGRPTKKQERFLTADTRYVGYGGARGGGKSHAIRAKAAYLAFQHPGIQMLIVRRTLPELRENHTKRLLAVYNVFPDDMRPAYNDTEKAFTFPWGSRLKLGYCAYESDVLQYQGQEYDVLFIDEATQLSEYQFRWLNACVRGVNGFPKRTYLTCNPGGIGHTWVKRLFIDREYRRSESADDYTFIQARVWDNAPLFEADAGYRDALRRLKKRRGQKPLSEIKEAARQQADYVRQLQNLPEVLRRAWLDGDWGVFAGQYFGEFSEEAHVCAPFPIPDEWRKSAALDYGLDMLAVLWFAVDTGGQVYCYRSIERPGLTVSAAAWAVRGMTEETIEEVIAPPDLWNRRQDSGRSAAEIFAENGVPLVKSGNSRIDGWLGVKEYLKADDGRPRMMFFGTCTPILRALPLLQHDTHNVNDAATEPHEVTHSPDALRYWCSRRQLWPEANTMPGSNPFLRRVVHANGEVGEDYLIGGYE
ncbi:MAG: phage terminase large subunit [Eubacteriales bacterium]|nr:phage terminase large subunit [Eubacteriales bacterium]